jgi:hypothetical protein
LLTIGYSKEKNGHRRPGILPLFHRGRPKDVIGFWDVLSGSNVGGDFFVRAIGGQK